MSILQKRSLRRLDFTPTINTSLTDGYFIAHHGILGMKWGVRRYQNKDGSLTEAGRKRYNKDNGEQRDTGLGTGSQNSSSKGNGKKVAIAAGLAAVGAAGVASSKEIRSRIPGSKVNKNYKNMSPKDLADANKRANLERNYKKNYGIKDSPEDLMDAANKGLEGVRKFANAGKVQSNGLQNRYNTRRTMSQKEMDAMSDQDLQKLVNRMNLETQYSRLTQDPPTKSKVEVGIDRAQAAMAIIGSAVVIGAGASTIYTNLKK